MAAVAHGSEHPLYSDCCCQYGANVGSVHTNKVRCLWQDCTIASDHWESVLLQVLTVCADDGVILSVPALQGVMLDVLSLRDWLPAIGWCMSCQWRFIRVMLALCTHLQYRHDAVSHRPGLSVFTPV